MVNNCLLERESYGSEKNWIATYHFFLLGMVHLGRG